MSRAPNNIVSRDASRAQCERIINGMHLLTPLTDGDIGTQQLACGLIYKMVASDDKLIQVLIDANYTAKLIEAVTTLQSYKLDNRAAAVVHSMIQHGTSEQISILVSQGCLQPFCDLLAKDNKRIIRAALSVISNICLVLSSFWDRGHNAAGTGLCQRLVELLSHSSVRVQGQASGVLRIIVSTDSSQAQCIIDGISLEVTTRLLDILISGCDTSQRFVC